MKKTLYTVTYDNEVLYITNSYLDMRDYIWEEFGSDFYDFAREHECTIDDQNCLDYCYELEINWQKFVIKI
jgi:hypothetical protein